MGGVGSDPTYKPGGDSSSGFGDGEGLGGLLGGAVGAVGGITGAGWGFLKEKVIDNDNVREKVGGFAALAGSAVKAVREKVSDGDYSDVLEAFKRNATLQ